MARAFTNGFYTSDEWISCRKAYAKSVGNLCERCLAKGLFTPGKVVHHKIHLTPENIDDPKVTMSWDNLQLLCQDCHAAVHRRKKRWKIDDDGNIFF